MKQALDDYQEKQMTQDWLKTNIPGDLFEDFKSKNLSIGEILGEAYYHGIQDTLKKVKNTDLTAWRRSAIPRAPKRMISVGYWDD